MLKKMCKFEFQKLIKGIFKKVKKRKIEIGKMALLAVVFILLSLGVEYLVFYMPLRKEAGKSQGIVRIENSDIKADGYVLNDNGEWVSQNADAVLTVETKRKFVNNFEIGLGGNPNYDIEISYIDTQTQAEILLKDKLSKSMQKNKLDFLDLMVYKIKSSPAEIRIKAPNAGVVIKEIKIDNSYRFNGYHFLFFLSIIFLIYFFILYRKNIGKKPEVVFFVIAIVCGMLLSFSELRTYVSWDEFIHFSRADETSFKSIIKKNVGDIYSKTNAVPASYSLKEQKILDRNFDARPNLSGKNKKSWWEKNSILGLYNGVAYVPSGMTLFFGRIFHLPYHIIFILGRFVNVFVYAAIVFFAIKKLKSGKMVMAVVALLPTSIFLASNYGYDSWVTAFVLLGLAYLFSELQEPEKKISKYNAIIMLGSFVVGLGPKAIYFPLMLFLFLLPKTKFSSIMQYKKFIWTSTFAILFVLGSFLLPFLVNGPGKGDSRGGEGVNSIEQVRFILTQPLAYTKILSNFMIEYVNPKNAEGYVSFFAYLGTIDGFAIIMAILLIVTITDKNEYDDKTASWKLKLYSVGIFLVTVALISTALYVSFTAVSSTTIAGVQPRYLIPVIFPLLFIIGSVKIRNNFNRNIYNGIIFIAMSFILLHGIWEKVISLHY